VEYVVRKFFANRKNNEGTVEFGKRIWIQIAS
jgi:hypothetical protein